MRRPRRRASGFDPARWRDALLGFVALAFGTALLATFVWIGAGTAVDEVEAGPARRAPAPVTRTDAVALSGGGEVAPAAEPTPPAGVAGPSQASEPRPVSPSAVVAPSGAPADAAPRSRASDALLSGMVVDAATGEPCEAELWLSIPGLAQTTNLVLQAPGGLFEQRLETPGEYALLARTPDGKVGVLRDVPVRAGGRTENLVIAVSEGARVRIVRAGDDAWTCVLYAGGAPVGMGIGPQAELVVPAGALTAKLRVSGTGEREERDLVATVGELTRLAFD